MITENSIKHLKMTCKFNWCSISWSNVGITTSISWLNMNEWKLLGVCLCRGGGGDLGLGSGFVYLIPCWVVMLSDRYMYKLSEPWENHRSCCRFSSRAASISVTDTPNECKLSCFFPLLHECLSHPPRFLCAPLKLTPFVTCERLHVSSGQWVSKVNSSERCFCTEQNWTLNSPVCKWPYV